jgi:hypothetical protein
MPGCTLGELSALEAIFSKLAADRRLPVARLMRPLMTVPMAEYRRLSGVTGGVTGGGTREGDDGARGGSDTRMSGGGDQGRAAGGGREEEEAAAAAALAERRASRLAFQLMRSVFVSLVGRVSRGLGRLLVVL